MKSIHNLSLVWDGEDHAAPQLNVETVEKVKFAVAILSEARQRIGMKIVCLYDRKCAKHGMIRVYGGHA